MVTMKQKNEECHRPVTSFPAGHVRTTFAPKLESVLRMDTWQGLQPALANVQFSSAASLFGAPGQGNYAAANAALEAHSAAASAMGLRQMAIQWGAWAAGEALRFCTSDGAA